MTTDDHGGSPEPQIIETSESLNEVCERLEQAEWLALDTEFLREKTYYPRLCLIQVADAHATWCIDPLAIDDLEPFFTLLDSPAITKVMHACRQDMEIFYHLRGHLPRPIFDTQVAAPLLGHPMQAGYARLVEAILGVHLDKGQTRSDWCRRPLNAKQIAYAGDDVHYLGRIYRTLHHKLERLGRLDWLAEDFAALSEPALYESPDEEAWRRIRAARRLRPKQLAILKTLAAWREGEAKRRDIPRNWLLKDDCLIDICQQRPTDLKALASIRGIGEATLKRHGRHLLELVDQAAHDPGLVDAAARPSRERLSARQEALVDTLMAIVQLRAAENALNPQVVASRKELSRLVLGETGSELMRGWKRALVGEELAAFLDGRRALRVEHGDLRTGPGEGPAEAKLESP